jgi:hypothetical protein
MSGKERISLNCSLAPPMPAATVVDGSNTPNTPDILNTIVNLTAGGPLFPLYTPPQPRLAAPPPPPSFMSPLAQQPPRQAFPAAAGIAAIPSGLVLPTPAACMVDPHGLCDPVDPMSIVVPEPTLYAPAAMGSGPVTIQGRLSYPPAATSPPPLMYSQKAAPVLLPSPAYSGTSVGNMYL